MGKQNETMGFSDILRSDRNKDNGQWKYQREKNYWAYDIFQSKISRLSQISTDARLSACNCYMSKHEWK